MSTERSHVDPTVAPDPSLTNYAIFPIDEDSSSFESSSSASSLVYSDILSFIPTKSADPIAVKEAVAAAARKRQQRLASGTPSDRSVSPEAATGGAEHTVEGDARLLEQPQFIWNILSFCDHKTLCTMIRVCHRMRVLATHDVVWKDFLFSMNLKPFLTAPIAKSLYRYFLEDIITTRALHGRYTFTAEDEPPNIVFNIHSVTLLISQALLGQMNHTVGRVQLLITYRNDPMEVLQGIARFSAHRKCFTFCCINFGSQLRGPIFTVAVATATKKWVNQAQDHFESHRGGIRLIMTPTLLEGRSVTSQITEVDVIAVSRPLKKGANP